MQEAIRLLEVGEDKAAIDKYPDRFKLLQETLKKTAADPALKEQLKKAGSDPAFLLSKP